MLWESIRGICAWLNVWGRLGECDRDRAILKTGMEENRQELKSLRKLYHVGTVTVDQRGQIIEVGPNFSEICGYSIDELLRMNLIELIPGRFHKLHLAAMHEVVEGKRELRRDAIAAELRRKDGVEIQVYVSLTMMPHGSGSKFRADVRRRNPPSEFDIWIRPPGEH